ncbi:DUF58 domain-containing protein [Rubellicoccus peritrichatus]|uniref:DUF58 domain-containing protein n=1 Tax=Rubellicoccus peritrichatus TaxID=3080537 RepID=A0AAQ3LB38_9BACT|nr:DUF58 domain-containing protein [Puniceicoccus sp. CR14]WOO42176.1 DUF58 domain-containing protein [Puniceicoccus sp. CR14]
MHFAPTGRSLIYAAVLLPSTLVAPLAPGLMWFALLLYSIWFLTAFFDWWQSRSCYDGVQIEITPVCRLSKDNPGSLEIFLKKSNGNSDSLVLMLGIPFHDTIESDMDTLEVQLKGIAPFWTVKWPVVSRQRGVFKIRKVYAATHSRWGFWELRKSFDVVGEIRVYPNLRRERQQLANLFLNRGLAGAHAQRVVGQGREYEQLRQYLPGDSLVDIHWKAAAKRGELVTKTFQVERTQEIYLVIDHSRMSARRLPGQNAETKFPESTLERFVTAASVLGLVASRQGDLFGMVSFHRKVTGFVRANSGRQHNQTLQDALFGLAPERVQPDFDELFSFIRMRLRRRALIIILTDLSDPVTAEAFAERVRMVSGQHLVIASMLKDDGVCPLFAEDNPVEKSADISQRIADHLKWHEFRELSKGLRREGVQLGLLNHERLSVEVVNQYLAVKARQAL